jgi:hypothetical protein
MSTKTKTLAKSLHTVTAIERVARLIQCRPGPHTPNAEAVRLAVAALGYEGAADPYGLAGKALKVMEG